MLHSDGYYRQPAVFGDRIVFVCEDDLWCVPSAGGTARRLTASRGAISFPCFSPDGKRLAFTGREDGPAEAYVMDAAGGALERLTYTGGYLRTVAWSRDGEEVIFNCNVGQPFLGALRLHAVPAAGGPAHLLPFGLAREIAFQPKGPGVVLGINSGDPARWKRYRGGTAGRLWVDRTGAGGFKPLLKLKGNLAGPMWIGNRIYFLSDHEGHGNLYSCTPTGRGLKRHTGHEDYYVRFPSTDGKRIVYHAGADLFLFDVASGKACKVEVALRSPRSRRNRKFVPAGRYLEDARLHPLGHSVACVARGGAFSFPLWEGAPTRHGAVSAARYRLVRWLPAGKRIVAVTDEPGEEALAVFPAGAPRRSKLVRGDFGRILDLEVAPAGAARVALANHRQELRLVELATGRSRIVARSAHDRIHGMAWSPDGRWLAFARSPDRRTSAIELCDTRSGKLHAVTRPDFFDYAPSFDPGGKYLYFLSLRVFDPVYDNQFFDLGFPRGVCPCLVPLAADAPSPFSDAARTPRAPHAGGKEPDKQAKRKGPPPVRIDLEAIADRVVAFPVDEARYIAVTGGHGCVFLASLPIEGSLGRSWAAGGEPPAKADLEVLDLDSGRTRPFLQSITSFSLSRDGKSVLVRVGNRLRALGAGIKDKEIPDKSEPGRESGWIDLDRLRVAIAPGAEWRQMFCEAWRLQRDQYWTADMAKTDWKAVRERYLPLVDRVACRSEFSDLMWEMQGELGTSHCYEMGGDYRPPPAWHQGFLGADLERTARGTWRIRRILRGDSWEERACSPLAAPGLGVRAGDTLIAVDGKVVGLKCSPFACLVNQAGREVVLELRSRGAKRSRKVTVRTLRQEFDLRYRDWVEANRERVHKRSKGRIGYLHIPNMGPRGYAEFHRYYRSEMDRDGLIVDVRWNGGGHVSELLLEKLLRRRIGYDASRWQGAMPYPSEAPMGPMVALTNEYAGSDGDIFSHCFKLYGLGPLIGKRTWGGVVGIFPRHSLVDGTITTQPEFAFWFEDVGFGVENYGTDPDIEVECAPQDHAAGRDPQLDRGLKELRAILRKAAPSRRPPRRS